MAVGGQYPPPPPSPPPPQPPHPQGYDGPPLETGQRDRGTPYAPPGSGAPQTWGGAPGAPPSPPGGPAPWATGSPPPGHPAPPYGPAPPPGAPGYGQAPPHPGPPPHGQASPWGQAQPSFGGATPGYPPPPGAPRGGGPWNDPRAPGGPSSGSEPQHPLNRTLLLPDPLAADPAPPPGPSYGQGTGAPAHPPYGAPGPYGAGTPGPAPYGAPAPPQPPHAPAMPGRAPYGWGPYGPRWPGARPYGPPYRPPRPKSGTTATVILGGLAGVMAAMFTILVLIGVLVDSGDEVDSISPIAVPTRSSADDQDRDRTADRERERADDAKDTDDTGESEVERRRRVLDTSLRNNTLYQAGRLPSVNCPGGGASIYDHRQLKALILKTSRCMDTAWSRILEKEGIEWRRPGYAIVAKRGRGACGDYPAPGSIVPYYCPRNETIYASTSAMARGSGNALGYGQITSWHGAIISMMAHEYGHHVQHLSGLSDSWWRETLEATSNSGRLALSRRFELQATCFGGMFMRAVSSSYPVTADRRRVLYYFYSRVGDHPGYPRDHGSPANNNRWFRQGFEKNRTFQCNTWLAPPNTTS